MEINIKLWIPKKSRLVTSDEMIKGLFTPTVNFDSRWCLKEIQWFKLYHSHQASASVSTLASKFKQILERLTSVNTGSNADARYEHGINLLQVGHG